MTVARGLRLGFITQASAAWDGGGLLMTSGVGRLVEALQARVRAIHLGISLAPRPLGIHDHRLAVDERHVSGYGFVSSMARAFLMWRELHAVVRAVEEVSDVVLVQLPWAPTAVLARPRRPRVYHVCADVRGVVGASKYYRGARGVAARLAAFAVDAGQRRLIWHRGARAVTNGEALYTHYGRPRGRAVVSSILRPSEVSSVTRRRPADAPLRLLFVGFLRPEKGIDTLLEAYEAMLPDAPGLELRLVGGQDLAEGGAARETAARIEALRRRAPVELLGHLPFGPALFQEYADADILVVPSRSEGTPRVLLEARAFGCAVVGTTVGGIPSSVTQDVDGLLVPPDAPSALANALLALVRDPARRMRLAATGLARARRTTVDDYADQITSEIVMAAEVAA